MKILFAINRDVIQSNLIHLLRQEGVNLDYDPERDSVFSKDLIIEKIKFNIGSSDEKYDIAIINEKLDGEYDLIEIVRFLGKNDIRPIILLGNRSDKDPLIHALIKRQVYDFLYGKLKLEDIYQCIVNPRKYEDVEHLVDINADEYVIQGKHVSDGIFESEEIKEERVIDSDTVETMQPVIKTPGIGRLGNKIPKLNIPEVPKNVPVGKSTVTQSAAPERVVIQENYVTQLPVDYKKNIAIYSNQQVGKSFVAANLATVFAMRGKKTILVDLDFKNKSQYYYFNMSKYERKAKDPEDLNIIGKIFEAEVHDVADLAGELFSPMRNLYVATCHPDLTIKNYTIDDLYKVYVMLKSSFDIVIYDLPGNCPEEFLRLIMTQVEEVIVLTNQNCSILDRTEKDLRDVLTGYFANQKVSLIINQYIDHKEMNKANIRDHLSVIENKARTIEINFKNIFTIPNNHFAVVDSIARGEPAVTFDGEMRRVFEDIANRYYPEVAPKRRG